MQFSKLALPLLLLTGLAGCPLSEELGTSATPIPALQSSPSSSITTTVEIPLTPDTADALMAELVNAINGAMPLAPNTATPSDTTSLSTSPDVFFPYLLERDRTVANVQNAIADYSTYLGGRITQVERQKIEKLGETGNGVPIQRFSYRLASDSGMSTTVALYQDDRIRLDDPFFNYSYWARTLVERFVNTINQGNPDQLAQLLGGEIPYPIAQTEDAIAHYHKSFDRGTLQYRFTDLQNDSFVYMLYGSQAGELVEHPITVIYGDGLVGIRDEFVAQVP